MSARYVPNSRFPHLLRHEWFRYHLNTTSTDNKLGYYECIRNSCRGRSGGKHLNRQLLPSGLRTIHKKRTTSPRVIISTNAKQISGLPKMICQNVFLSRTKFFPNKLLTKWKFCPKFICPNEFFQACLSGRVLPISNVPLILNPYIWQANQFLDVLNPYTHFMFSRKCIFAMQLVTL